ncbi:MAG: hypothetical protein DLM57_10555 [Pseudonocardiales bacterium]|nr:MAG: hypothetical protein DLM57_10555 [Pseudonocardiales bacterium]
MSEHFGGPDRDPDKDVADWNASGRVPLGLVDKDVEVMAHVAIRPTAPLTERAHDLWPDLPPLVGIERLFDACERVNTAATAASGKSGPVIIIPGRHHESGVPSPKVRVRTLGRPDVDVSLTQASGPAASLTTFQHLTDAAQGAMQQVLAEIESGQINPADVLTAVRMTLAAAERLAQRTVTLCRRGGVDENVLDSEFGGGWAVGTCILTGEGAEKN